MSKYLASQEFRTAQVMSAKAQISTIESEILRLQAKLATQNLGQQHAKDKNLLNESGIISAEQDLNHLKDQIQAKQSEISEIKVRFSI